MLRAGTGWLACGLLFVGVASGQDSGPGPIAGTGTATYDVTVLKVGSTATGTFAFTVEEPASETPTTTSVITTGTFTSSLGEITSTGTWRAIDAGNYAVWFGTATNTTGTQTITGFSTPDSIGGVIVTRSTTSTGRLRFLQSLFNTSIFYGSVAEVEMPPTDEPTVAN